jgi:hypothetical protein
MRSNFNHETKIQNPFCEYPFNYIKKIDLANEYDFQIEFIDVVKKILDNKQISKKIQERLKGGFQTAGNIFSIAADETTKIKNIILSEVEKYRSYFKNSDEGLIKQWPKVCELNGWLVNMRSGGELKSHIHEMGWISGSIYINVPPKVKNDSGNLVLCINDIENDLKGFESPNMTINVVTGMLVLFPSSLMHYTVPFHSEENRIVLAFDLMPTGSQN